DEPDGSVTATVGTGAGYTISNTHNIATVAVSDDDDPPPPPPVVVPVVSVAAGPAVAEGQNAVFTVTADPAPASALTVTVAVTQAGDYGVTTGSRTVVVPTTGSAQLSVATTGDSIDEPNGSVSVTVNTGSGYTISGTHASATVAVSDDDPPPPPPPVVVPVVSVAAGPAVAEGQNAVFTVTADPAPASPLTVTIAVAQTGDYGVTTGSRTVVVPTTGSAQLSVATVGDGVDEPDGSITVKVAAGTGYTISGTHASATVAVSDDDNPPPSPPPAAGASLSVRDMAVSENGRSLRFMVYLSETPDTAVTVRIVTRDGTARNGADYRGYSTPSRTLRFAKGTRLLYRYTYIPILDDNATEGDETFQAILTNPTGATISRGTATITITDND
ncbi:MAG: hypothetical protein OXG47_08865, partial [bacterium]|nr:hypothetical protein [bacterium]